MYSMVLMAALTTGTDMPDWFGSRGGWGCCGCYGGYAWGGYGGYGWGGYGRGWGGYGWGGYGYGGDGGYGGWGYAYSPVYSGYAAPVIVSNTISNDPARPVRSITIRFGDSGMTGDDRRSSAGGCHPDRRWQAHEVYLRHATVCVSPLEEDKGYHYIFKAERKRDGETITTTQRVEVRAGETRQVYLKFAKSDQSVERLTYPPDLWRKRLVKNGARSPSEETVRATHWSPKQADTIRYQVRAAHAAQRSKRLLAAAYSAALRARLLAGPLTPLRCVRGCWLGRSLRCAAGGCWRPLTPLRCGAAAGGPLTPLRCVRGCWLGRLLRCAACAARTEIATQPRPPA